MAVQTWDGGAADNNLATAANWTNNTAPVDTESFGFTSDGNGTPNPTGNMAAFAAFDAADVFVERGYNDNIGANGQQLDLNTWNHFIHRGGGKVWLLAGGGTCDIVTVISSADSPLTEAMSLSGATTTTLNVIRGLVTVDGAATVDNLCVGAGDYPERGANLTVVAGANVNMGYMYDGYCRCSTDLDEDLTIRGGEWDQDTATIAGAAVVFGGRFNYDFTGTIPLVIQYGGIIDVTRKGGQKTFTRFIRLGGECIGLGTPMLTTTQLVDLTG